MQTSSDDLLLMNILCPERKSSYESRLTHLKWLAKPSDKPFKFLCISYLAETGNLIAKQISFHTTWSECDVSDSW